MRKIEFLLRGFIFIVLVFLLAFFGHLNYWFFKAEQCISITAEK